MARLLVVNADDLGASDGVNEGIMRAHQDGIVTSASLMVDRPASKGGAALARALPGLSIGLHFERWAQTDLDDPAVQTGELARQLARFRDLVGAEPTHLDSHHHVHLEGERLHVFLAAARPLGVPVRGASGINYIGGFWGQRERGISHLAHIQPTYLHQLVAEEVADGLNELGCHPAASVEGLSSSYAQERLVELATLTHPGLREAVRAVGIRLVSFAEWPSPVG